MTATAKKAAPKTTTAKPAPKAKPDKTICRWGEGRYFSPKTAKACGATKAPKKELCSEHEVAMRAAKKGLTPAKPKAESKPRSAGTSPKTTGDPMAREIAATKAMKAKVAKNSGGQKRTSTPPTPPRVPVARVNAPEQAPQLVQLVTAE